MSRGAVNRFYKMASAEESDDGWSVRLDSAPLKTRKRNIVIAPTKALADAIAAEWNAQGETLDLAATPLSNLLGTALDAGAANNEAWRKDILDYLGSDLLCYRAEGPAALRQAQAAAWNPFLDWLRKDLGAALVTTTGVISVAQPDIAMTRIRALLADQSMPALFAMRQATALTGSAVLALALLKGAFSADEIFDASLIDERFQARQWGEDAEAAARREAMRGEFMHIARFLRLI